jgi:hypothetical protein
VSIVIKESQEGKDDSKRHQEQPSDDLNTRVKERFHEYFQTVLLSFRFVGMCPIFKYNDFMSGRKEYGPRFTILDRAHLLENKKAKPIDRSDRSFIDNGNLKIFWSVKKLRNEFIQKTEQIREIVGIETLKINEDILINKLGHKGSLFIPKSLHIGINSMFLRDNPKTAKNIQKLIYSNILIPLNWSFNFYPFVEHYVLYGRKPNQEILPNPKQFQLILKHHRELGRNTYTKSDIAFLKQQAIIERATRPKKLREIETIVLALDNISTLKNTERRPRNLAFKIAAFDVFGRIPAQATISETMRFIQDNTYEIITKYNPNLNPNEDEEKLLFANIKKLYKEYLKLIHND